MIIRKANIKDAKKLSYLIQMNAEKVNDNQYTAVQRLAWSAQNKPNDIKEQLKTRIIFCAFENNRLVGTIAIKDNLVCGMYISYSKRGHGIGQKLLNHIERFAKNNEINELILTASPNGYGFYLKNGYKTYGKMTHIFDGIKFPEIKMKKQL